MTDPVVGVDPGGRTTGIVARRGERLIHAEIVTNDGAIVTVEYLRDVVAAVANALILAAGTVPLVGVEGLTHPSPHLGIANIRGLLDTAQVIGALTISFPGNVVIVKPAKHGSAPLRSYPAPLVGSQEKGTYGSGKLRHARSAYDVAGATKAAALLVGR